MQSEFRHTAHHDFHERAKFEGKHHHEADEEHLSQPSTMHSLGNLEEHTSPARETPKSSRFHQFGHHIKHEAQVQIGSIRNTLRRVFGEKVDTARDNDENTKQVVKNVNQEILQLPKRNERIIESTGQGSGMGISSHRFPAFHVHGFGRITEIRDQVSRYMPQVREEAHFFVSVARSHLDEIINNFRSNFNWADARSPSTDLSPWIKEQLNKVNEDIRQLPRRNERVIESTGQAQSQKEERPIESQKQSQGSYKSFAQYKEEKERSQVEQPKSQQPQSKKPGEQDLWNMAFHKIEEMKEKAHQKGQEFKHEAERSQIDSERNEQIWHLRPQAAAERQDIHHLHHEHHHLSAQSPSFEPHHLTAQSPSFQSTEHSRELAQTVKEGLKDSSVPLTKKVEEVESHWKHEEGHGESLRQGAQELKSKISGKVGEIKQSIQSGKERVPLVDKITNRIRAMSEDIHHTFEDIKESFKVEERPHDDEPLLDKVMGGYNRTSGRKYTYDQPIDKNDIASMLIHNLENPPQKSTDNDIASMLVHNLDVGKNKFPRRIEEITFTLYEDHSLKERIQEKIHNISNKIQRRKSVGDFEEATFTLYEDHSIKAKIEEKIHNISEKVRRRKSAGDLEEITFTLYEDHSMKERIQEGIHHLSDQIHNAKDKFNALKHDMPLPEGEINQKLSGLRTQNRNLQDFVRRQQENLPEGYHSVATGFSQTVQEHLHKKKSIGPLKSQNPFEAFEAEADEADEPESITEVLPDQPPFDLSESQEKHSLAHRIKESLAKGIEAIKRRLARKHKKTFEEAHPLVPMEVQNEEEEYEEEPQFEDDEPSKGKIRQSLEELSSKISHDIDMMKDKFKSKKGELQKAKEEKETLKGKIFEVKPQEIPTTKQNAGAGLHHAKRKMKKAQTPKSASKAYPNENKGPSFEGFHEIASGFSKSVVEFKKELRGPPLVSSNPFSGLVAGTVPRRKVSFQEPQQQKKKVLRLSQSAGKEAKKKRFEDFQRITSGFSESVEHFQREIRGAPVISKNPFESLGTTQGSVKKTKKLPGTDITNKIVGESHVKTLIQKTKVEIHDVSHKISGKIHHAKDKIKSAFHHAEDKENIAQTA